MQIRAFDDARALTQAAVALLGESLRAPCDGPCAVLLPGGQTPLAAYRRLALCPVKVADGMHVALSDERLVPDTDPESNFGRLQPLLAALRLPPHRVLCVRSALPLAAAADDYHAAFETFFAHGGRIRLGLLGLGADGHTASLFSAGEIEAGRGRWAQAVKRPQGPPRVSVTADLLARAERLVFLAAGEAKRAVVERLTRDPLSVPAGRAVAAASEVAVWHARRG